MDTKTDKPRTNEPAIKPDTPAPEKLSVSATDLSHGNPDFMHVVPETMKPELHYRWVRSRQDESHIAVQRARMKGYSFVKKGDVQLLVPSDNRGDSNIYVGDCVLMACPKEVKIKRDRDKRQQREATLASTTAVTKQKAKEIGVKLIQEENVES
jgi:hypothetical protein